MPNTTDYLPDSLVSLMELYQRGITPGMAWQLLGTPHKSDTNRPFPKVPHRQYYLRSFVATQTQGHRFQALRITSVIHQLIKGEQNLKTMSDWARSVPIKTDIPDLPWNDIIEIACLDRWARHGFHIQPNENSRGMRILWAYTYLKHNRTNYDELCDYVTGKMFSRYVYPIILHRVNKEILDRFPQCLSKVKGLRTKNSMTKCPTCQNTATGVFNGHYWEKPPGWLYQLTSNGNYIRTLCSRECTRRRKEIPRKYRRHYPTPVLPTYQDKTRISQDPRSPSCYPSPPTAGLLTEATASRESP